MYIHLTPNISYIFISLHFCSNCSTCSPLPPNSDPSSGPHLLLEVPQACYVVFCCKLQRLFTHLVLSHVLPCAVLFCLIFIWFRAVYHLGQLLGIRGHVLSCALKAEGILLWQWQLLHEGLLDSVLSVGMKSRDLQIIERQFSIDLVERQPHSFFVHLLSELREI